MDEDFGKDPISLVFGVILALAMTCGVIGIIVGQVRQFVAENRQNNFAQWCSAVLGKVGFFAVVAAGIAVFSVVVPFVLGFVFWSLMHFPDYCRMVWRGL